MKYSFWKLLFAQWSWKRVLKEIGTSTVLALLVALVYFYTGTITSTETGEVLSNSTLEYYLVFLALFVGLFIWIEGGYQVLKLLILSVMCGGLVYYANSEGEDAKEAQEFYKEMMVWRD